MTTMVTRVRGTAEILTAAARYLAEYGWTPTGVYDPHNGCTGQSSCTITGADNCWPRLTGKYPASIIGAIRYVVHGAPRWYLDTTDGEALHAYTAALEWFNSYLLAVGRARMHASVFDWETAPGRNGLQVISALHHAAAAHQRHTESRAA
jgi:hypothetical protein